MITLLKKLIALIFISSVYFNVSGCDGNNNAKNNLDAATYGQVISFDLAAINLEGAFNKWGEVQRGTSILEVLLEQKDDPLNNPTHSNWSLNIRSLPDPNGLKDISELDVRLFTNYLSQCCANLADPVGRSEIYNRAFVAVAGSIDFNTSSEGEFDLYFQEEIPARSNNVIGPIVNIKGCWNVASEGATSGCNL